MLWNALKKKKRQNPHKIPQQKFPITEGEGGQGGAKGFGKVTESQWQSTISHWPIH